MSRIVYLTDDLLYSSQIVEAVRRAGWTMDLVMNVDDLSQRISKGESSDGDVRLVVLDLSTRGLAIADTVASVRAQNRSLPLIAYGPHVHTERLEAARNAGCDEVLSRGAFSHDPIAVIGRYVTTNDATNTP